MHYAFPQVDRLSCSEARRGPEYRLLLCSTFGRELADAFGCDFIDADDHHPAANIGGQSLPCPARPGHRPKAIFIPRLAYHQYQEILACQPQRQSWLHLHCNTQVRK